MSEQMNTPMLPEPSGVSGWLPTWREAVTRPSEQTFARISSSPQAKSTTALLWVFLGSLVNFFLASLVQGAMVRNMFQNSDFNLDQFGGGAGSSLITAICGAPVAAIVSTVVFAVFVGVVQLVAKMFGGRGTFDQLAYAIAAIVTPFYFISGALSLLGAIPYVGLCFGLLGLIAGLYVLVLEVMAVKGVNQFGWGQAAGSFLVPLFVVVCCLAVGLFGIFQMMGPRISEIFDSINQSLP
jgi:Yip1-like protein